VNDPRPPDKPDSHWYSLTPTPRVEERDTSRAGAARDRRERRQTTGDLKQSLTTRPARRPAPQHLFIGGAVAVVALFLVFIISVSGSGGAAVTTPRPLVVAANTPATLLPVLALPEIKAWTGKERFTILLMGLDARPDQTLRDARTDTMILLSLDPETKQAGMLSIPRDLYVAIPGEAGINRINTAYVSGELRKPNSGPLLAMQTVQYNLGIKVNAYAALSFQAVITLVDAVGGVDLDIPVPIDDEEYPDMNFGYEPLHIPAGKQHLNGTLALKFARTRHQTDDYDRTHRQQQLLLTLKEKVTKRDMLPQLLGQAPLLWSTLKDGFLTNLTLDQILSLASLVKDVPLEKIQSGSIEGDYTQAVPGSADQAVTIRRDKIGVLLVKVFGPNYAK